MGLAKNDRFYCPHNFLNPNLLRIYLAKPITLLVHRMWITVYHQERRTYEGYARVERRNGQQE